LKPLGEGSLYAAQIGGVGFHSFPGVGAESWQTAAAMKMIHETHEKHEKKQKNLCNLWFLLFFSSLGEARIMSHCPKNGTLVLVFVWQIKC
jgi:hypothetical protein